MTLTRFLRWPGRNRGLAPMRAEGLCGQVFGPRSPDAVPERCQIGDVEGNITRRAIRRKDDAQLVDGVRHVFEHELMT